MKSGKLALTLLACATSSVFAQTSSPQCEATNFDQARGIFTVINPAPGALNQQCFITIQPAGAGGRFTEGSYEIVLSGGGGGGGGVGDGRGRGRDAVGFGGQGGAGALPSRTVVNLAPGVYRLTMGTGGQGGGAGLSSSGGHAAAGNPTGMVEAYSGQTIAGFPGAEKFAGYSGNTYLVAGSTAGIAGPIPVSDGRGPGAVNGPSGGSKRDGAAESGWRGGHGYIKLTQLTPTPRATPAPAVIEQAPAPVMRPARQTRN